MLHQTTGYKVIHQWLEAKEFYAFAFQEEAWDLIIRGESGLVNAPTGDVYRMVRT